MWSRELAATAMNEADSGFNNHSLAITTSYQSLQETFLPTLHNLPACINKYGTLQELHRTFSRIKSINIDFSLVLFVILYVNL